MHAVRRIELVVSVPGLNMYSDRQSHAVVVVEPHAHSEYKFEPIRDVLRTTAVM